MIDIRDADAYIYHFFETYITTCLPEVHSVDLFFNQFEEEDAGEVDARTNPKIGILINEHEDMAKGTLGRIQTFIGTVTLFIGIDITDNFTSDSSLKEQNLAYLNLLGDIYLQLSAISSYDLPDDLKNDTFMINNVKRTRKASATNSGDVKVSQIDFQFIVQDNTRYKAPITGFVDSIDLTINIPT